MLRKKQQFLIERYVDAVKEHVDAFSQQRQSRWDAMRAECEATHEAKMKKIRTVREARRQQREERQVHESRWLFEVEYLGKDERRARSGIEGTERGDRVRLRATALADRRAIILSCALRETAEEEVSERFKIICVDATLREAHARQFWHRLELLARNVWNGKERWSRIGVQRQLTAQKEFRAKQDAVYINFYYSERRARQHISDDECWTWIALCEDKTKLLDDFFESLREQERQRQRALDDYLSMLAFERRHMENGELDRRTFIRGNEVNCRNDIREEFIEHGQVTMKRVKERKEREYQEYLGVCAAQQKPFIEREASWRGALESEESTSWNVVVALHRQGISDCLNPLRCVQSHNPTRTPTYFLTGTPLTCLASDFSIERKANNRYTYVPALRTNVSVYFAEYEGFCVGDALDLDCVEVYSLREKYKPNHLDLRILDGVVHNAADVPIATVMQHEDDAATIQATAITAKRVKRQELRRTSISIGDISASDPPPPPPPALSPRSPRAFSPRGGGATSPRGADESWKAYIDDVPGISDEGKRLGMIQILCTSPSMSPPPPMTMYSTGEREKDTTSNDALARCMQVLRAITFESSSPICVDRTVLIDMKVDFPVLEASTSSARKSRRASSIKGAEAAAAAAAKLHASASATSVSSPRGSRPRTNVFGSVASTGSSGSGGAFVPRLAPLTGINSNLFDTYHIRAKVRIRVVEPLLRVPPSLEIVHYELRGKRQDVGLRHVAQLFPCPSLNVEINEKKTGSSPTNQQQQQLMSSSSTTINNLSEDDGGGGEGVLSNASAVSATLSPRSAASAQTMQRNFIGCHFRLRFVEPERPEAESKRSSVANAVAQSQRFLEDCFTFNPTESISLRRSDILLHGVPVAKVTSGKFSLASSLPSTRDISVHFCGPTAREDQLTVPFLGANNFVRPFLAAIGFYTTNYDRTIRRVEASIYDGASGSTNCNAAPCRVEVHPGTATEEMLIVTLFTNNTTAFVRTCSHDVPPAHRATLPRSKCQVFPAATVRFSPRASSASSFTVGWIRIRLTDHVDVDNDALLVRSSMSATAGLSVQDGGVLLHNGSHFGTLRPGKSSSELHVDIVDGTPEALQDLLRAVEFETAGSVDHPVVKKVAVDLFAPDSGGGGGLGDRRKSTVSTGSNSSYGAGHDRKKSTLSVAPFDPKKSASKKRDSSSAASGRKKSSVIAAASSGKKQLEPRHYVHGIYVCPPSVVCEPDRCMIALPHSPTPQLISAFSIPVCEEDEDRTFYDGGTLKLDVVNGCTQFDLLGIEPDPSNGFYVEHSTDGMVVRIGDVEVGSFPLPIRGMPLIFKCAGRCQRFPNTLAFNADTTRNDFHVTREHMRRVIERLSYSNFDRPCYLAKLMHISLVDAHSGTSEAVSEVEVTVPNAVTRLHVACTDFHYRHGDPSVGSTNTLRVFDKASMTDDDTEYVRNGYFVVDPFMDATLDDQFLLMPSRSLLVEGSTILLNGNRVGTYRYEASLMEFESFRIDFFPGVTLDTCAIIVQHVGYAHAAPHPRQPGLREFLVRFNAGDGAEDTRLKISINVQPPLLWVFPMYLLLHYAEGSGPVPVQHNVFVGLPSHTPLAGSTLEFSFTEGLVMKEDALAVVMPKRMSIMYDRIVVDVPLARELLGRIVTPTAGFTGLVIGTLTRVLSNVDGNASFGSRSIMVTSPRRKKSEAIAVVTTNSPRSSDGSPRHADAPSAGGNIVNNSPGGGGIVSILKSKRRKDETVIGIKIQFDRNSPATSEFLPYLVPAVCYQNNSVSPLTHRRQILMNMQMPSLGEVCHITTEVEVLSIDNMTEVTLGTEHITAVQGTSVRIAPGATVDDPDTPVFEAPHSYIAVDMVNTIGSTLDEIQIENTGIVTLEEDTQQVRHHGTVVGIVDPVAVGSRNLSISLRDCPVELLADILASFTYVCKEPVKHRTTRLVEINLCGGPKVPPTRARVQVSVLPRNLVGFPPECTINVDPHGCRMPLFPPTAQVTASHLSGGEITIRLLQVSEVPLAAVHALPKVSGRAPTLRGPSHLDRLHLEPSEDAPFVVSRGIISLAASLQMRICTVDIDSSGHRITLSCPRGSKNSTGAHLTSILQAIEYGYTDEAAGAMMLMAEERSTAAGATKSIRGGGGGGGGAIGRDARKGRMARLPRAGSLRAGSGSPHRDSTGVGGGSSGVSFSLGSPTRGGGGFPSSPGSAPPATSSSGLLMCSLTLTSIGANLETVQTCEYVCIK